MSFFRFRHYRDGVLLSDRKAHNTATVEGLFRAMRNAFDDIAKSTFWFLGLISDGAVVVSDTGAAHAFTEFMDYTESGSSTTRDRIFSGSQVSTSGDGIASYIANSVDVVFTGAGVIVGAFMIGTSDKGGFTGDLWGGANLDEAISVLPNDTLSITYDLDMEVSDSFGSP